MSRQLFSQELSVFNIGTQNFCDGLRGQNVPVYAVEWRPPADARLIRLLRRCDETGLTGRIEEANQEVLERMLTADPVWVGIRPAIEVLPGMRENYILHSGPPLPYEKLGSIHKKGIVGGVLHEKLAATKEEAEELLKSGRVEVYSCYDFAAVGAGPGSLRRPCR